MGIQKLDRTARFTVAGWAGIAFRISGFPKRWEPETAIVPDHDTGEDIEIPTGEGEWVEQDESCGEVVVVMVGDDRKHKVGIEDLTPLAEDAYCGSCGQVGCGWGVH